MWLNKAQKGETMMMNVRIRWVFTATSLLFLLSSARSILGDTPKFPTVLYGASYYHEYMPYERLEKDVELMEKAGISFARVGESTWGLLEPRDGEFDFAWLERVIDRLHKAGIKVILGTPTYSQPGSSRSTLRSRSSRSTSPATPTGCAR
jgi:hypothetical protein